MAEENVSGIAVGLSLETSGFSSGIARAKSELQSLQEAARNISIGVSVAAPGRQTGRGGVQEPGVAVALPGVQPRVSPRFNVSAGAVRDLRTDINAQMRTFASQGEGVAVGIKLGRVPYARLRSEIETGIGTVTIRSLAIAPSAITAAARQLANPAVAVNVAAAGVPKRAAGGSVSPHQTYVVGERRAELFRPTTAGRIEQLPHAWTGGPVEMRLSQRQRNYTGNLREAARQLTPKHIAEGLKWYTDAEQYGRQMARQYQIAEDRALGTLAALSAGTSWKANKTKFERMLKEQAAGRTHDNPLYSQTFDAHVKANDILYGVKTPAQAFASSPKVGQFYSGISGDLSALVIDRWATRTATRGALEQPTLAMRPRMERSWRKVGAEHGMQNAPFQAALWLMEKERSGAANRARGGGIRGHGGKYGSAKPASSRSYADQQTSLWGSPESDEGYAYHQTDAIRSIREGSYRGPGVQPEAGGTSWWTRGGAPMARAHLSAPGMRLLRTPMSRQFYDSEGNFYGDGPLGQNLQTGRSVPRSRLQYWGEDSDWHHFRRGRSRAGGGKVDAFGHPYRGSFSKHYGTQKHQAAMYPTYGRKMRGKTRPSWMVGEGQEPWEYDDEGNRVPMARGGRMRGAGFVPGLRSLGQAYNRGAGLEPMQEQMLHPVDPDFGRRTALAYEGLPMGASGRDRRAYRAFASETDAQYAHLTAAGYRFEHSRIDPYHPTGRKTKMQLAAEDVRKNKRLKVFSSALEHPLMSDEENWRFRGVHDLFGHMAEGYSIGPRGEFNAAVKHSQMYSPEAQLAMLAETHGQNSVVNFSPTIHPAFGRSIADVNRESPGSIYADQKSRALPKRILDEFYAKIGRRATGGQALGPIGRRIAARANEPVLRLMSGGRRVDAPIGVGPQDVDYAARFNQDVSASESSLRARPTKLPKGVKVRFSTEWSDYPDPSKFLTSGGGLSGLERRPGSRLYHEQDVDPGQLTLSRGGTQRMPLRHLENYGTSEQPSARFASVSDWMLRGMVPGGPSGGQPRLAAYALDQRNRVLGHALFEAGVATTERGPAMGTVAHVLHPDYVWVDPKLHGKGIASAMYARAERFTGMSTAPSGSQTAHGKRMWSTDPMQRHFGRAFGQRQMTLKDLDTMRQVEGTRAGPFGSGWKAFEDEDAPEPFRDFSSAVDPVTEMRRKRLGRVKGQMRLPGFRAAGGEAGGTYVVSELGKELFVPTSKEHLIPPNVAAQIPGGGSLAQRIAARQPQAAPEPWKPAWLRRGSAKDLTGRAGGGMVEIGGHGPMVWQAPEDGWIIPNHLMNKVPRAARGASPARQAQIDRDQRLAEIAQRREAIRASIPDVGQLVPYEESVRAASQAAAIELAAGTRGLSAKQNVAGIFAGLTGATGRREALAQARYLEPQIQRFLPAGATPGTDPMSALRERMALLNREGTELNDTLSQTPVSFRKGSEAFKLLGTTTTNAATAISVVKDETVLLDGVYKKQQGTLANAIAQTKDHTEATAELSDTISTVTGLEEKRDAALSKVSSGALTNIASLTAAGFVFSAASQAVSVAAGLASKALAPVVDGLTGFTAANTRVSAGLAERLPQAGNLQTLFGQVGVEAGLSGGNTSFLQGQLGGGVLAKAGAAKAGQAQELFRAALGTGAPQGLVGGFGGVLGGAFLGSELGGGKGLLETIAQTAAETTGTPQQAPSGPENAFGVGIDAIGGALSGFARDMNKTGKGISTLISPEQTAKAAGVQKETIDYVNEAITRGRQAQGLTGGAPKLENVGVGNAEAQAIAGNLTLDPLVRQLAQSGEVFRDSQNKIVTDLKGISDIAGQISTGLAIPDKAAFAAANAQQLRAGQQTAQAQGEFERGVAIPGAIGQQILANPFQAAATGLEKGFKPTIASLGQISKDQADLTAQARVDVERMAKKIDELLPGLQPSGMTAGNQFRQDMTQVEAYGQQIADINAAVMDRQAALGAKQYAYNLMIINRNIRDAKGLAGQAGGSRLGRIERQQYELGRESTGLGLQSTGLSLQMNQREINFSKALAGFQAVGISGEERAARMAEAEAQAKYQQQQQNIAVKQFGISQQQFGLEGQAFGIQTGRQVTDLEGQKAILQQSHALEQEQLAAQKQIVAISMKQSKIQQDATSLFSQATGNFNNRLAVSAQYVAMYSGTIVAADAYIKKALGLLTPKGKNSSGSPDERASGIVGLTLGPTTQMYGEAGTEGVAIIKNPRMGTIPSGLGMGGGGGTTVNVYISGNSIREDKDIDTLTRRVTDEVVEAIGRKAGMLSLAS